MPVELVVAYSGVLEEVGAFAFFEEHSDLLVVGLIRRVVDHLLAGYVITLLFHINSFMCAVELGLVELCAHSGCVADEAVQLDEHAEAAAEMARSERVHDFHGLLGVALPLNVSVLDQDVLRPQDLPRNELQGGLLLAKGLEADLLAHLQDEVFEVRYPADVRLDLHLDFYLFLALFLRSDTPSTSLLPPQGSPDPSGAVPLAIDRV